MDQIKFTFSTTEAIIVYDLLLQTYETYKKANNESYKMYEPILNTIEKQHPGYKAHREIVKTID